MERRNLDYKFLYVYNNFVAIDNLYQKRPKLFPSIIDHNHKNIFCTVAGQQQLEFTC